MSTISWRSVIETELPDENHRPSRKSLTSYMT